MWRGALLRRCCGAHSTFDVPGSGGAKLNAWHLPLSLRCPQNIAETYICLYLLLRWTDFEKFDGVGKRMLGSKTCEIISISYNIYSAGKKCVVYSIFDVPGSLRASRERKYSSKGTF